jgi:hypothetical protein
MRVIPPAHPTPSTGSQKTKWRDRRTDEATSDAYLATLQVTALKAVTVLAQESLRVTAKHREKIRAEHPDIEVALTGLMVNQARLLAEVQENIVNDRKRK